MVFRALHKRLDFSKVVSQCSITRRSPFVPGVTKVKDKQDTHSLTHSLTILTHPPTHSLTHSLLHTDRQTGRQTNRKPRAVLPNTLNV